MRASERSRTSTAHDLHRSALRRCYAALPRLAPRAFHQATPSVPIMTNDAARPLAVLVAVQLPGVADVEHAADLAELGRLVHTLGFDVVATRHASGAARSPPRAVLGEGKLKELADAHRRRRASSPGRARAQGQGAARCARRRTPRTSDAEDDADDDERRAAAGGDAGAQGHGRGRRPRDLAEPGAQPRARHRRRGARSHGRHRRDLPPPRQEPRGAAAGRDRAPQLRGAAPARGGGGGRQRGGIGGKGAGESALELDRRKIRDRIAELREELAAIQREQDTRRARAAAISCASRSSATPTPASRR